MFQVLSKITGGKPRATRRSYGGRRVILKALRTLEFLIIFQHTSATVPTAKDRSGTDAVGF